MSKQYDPYTDAGFGYSCLCGDYDHGTIPERVICAACKVEEQKHQLATITQERDALREVVEEMIAGGNHIHDESNCHQDCPWVRCRGRAASLLSPPAGAGNVSKITS